MEPNKKSLFRFEQSIRQKLNGEGYDLWFVWLNRLALLPILAWPLLFFGSIFLFDNPTLTATAYLTFFLILCYPIILFILIMWSFKLYNRNKYLAALIPILIIVLFLYAAIFYLNS